MLLLWLKVLHLTKNVDYLQKNADISKIKKFLVLKGIFSKTTYVFVLTYQISSSSHNSDKFYAGTTPSTPTAKRTRKKLSQIKVKQIVIVQQCNFCVKHLQTLYYFNASWIPNVVKIAVILKIIAPAGAQ